MIETRPLVEITVAVKRTRAPFDVKLKQMAKPFY